MMSAARNGLCDRSAYSIVRPMLVECKNKGWKYWFKLPLKLVQLAFL